MLRQLSALAAVALVGCRTPIQPPLPAQFKAVVAEPYYLNINDCSNKSVKYAKRLHEAGYNSAIVVVSTGRTADESHAVVAVRQLGYQTIYLDPTHGTTTTNLADWGQLLYELHPMEDLVKAATDRGFAPAEFQEQVSPAYTK